MRPRRWHSLCTGGLRLPVQRACCDGSPNQRSVWVICCTGCLQVRVVRVFGRGRCGLLCFPTSRRPADGKLVQRYKAIFDSLVLYMTAVWQCTVRVLWAHKTLS